MKTVVINNRAGLHMAQMPHTYFKSNNGGKEILPPQIGETITFMPGANLIDSGVLATLRKNKEFDRLFTDRIAPSKAPEHDQERTGKVILFVDTSIGKEGQVEDSKPLEKLSLPMCRALIEETLTIEPLERYLLEEHRGEVLSLIRAQIAHLKSGEDATPATAGR